MSNMKKYSFFVGEKKTCWVIVPNEQTKRFEVMMRRLIRYAGRFGYDIQYESEFV